LSSPCNATELAFQSSSVPPLCTHLNEEKFEPQAKNAKRQGTVLVMTSCLSIKNYSHERFVSCDLSRYGLRGRELLNTVGKTMVQGGGTFGTFMAIGTGIRC